MVYCEVNKMPSYTLTESPEVELFVDGTRAVIAADALGATILSDIYLFLTGQLTQNSVGVSLRYSPDKRVWLLPDGSFSLFNVCPDENIFFDLNKRIKEYNKSLTIKKYYGQVWGFLCTDEGLPLELNPQELICLSPQPKRKCVEDIYLTSKPYQLHFTEEMVVFAEFDDAKHIVVLNNYNLEENLSSSVLFENATIKSVYNSTNLSENLETEILFESAQIKNILLSTSNQVDELETDVIFENAQIKNILLQAIIDVESVETSVVFENAQFG